MPHVSFDDYSHVEVVLFQVATAAEAIIVVVAEPVADTIIMDEARIWGKDLVILILARKRLCKFFIGSGNAGAVSRMPFFSRSYELSTVLLKRIFILSILM